MRLFADRFNASKGSMASPFFPRGDRLRREDSQRGLLGRWGRGYFTRPAAETSYDLLGLGCLFA